MNISRVKTLVASSALCVMLGSVSVMAQSYSDRAAVVDKDNTFISKRPPVDERLFRSNAVELKIKEVSAQLTNPKLRWMFANCFPNTLDTTVHFRHDEKGNPETFVYTGDIAAMWLRDSGAQVWPYLQLIDEDSALRKMIVGTIRQQLKLILRDPYANAFLDSLDEESGFKDDWTTMLPGVHERKWEIDSLCYPIRLAYEYWKKTGDLKSIEDLLVPALEKVYATFREQQRKDGVGGYTFMRLGGAATDSKSNSGKGEPVNPVGLIVSSFRPSDDATHFQFLVPSNFFAVTSSRKASEMLAALDASSLSKGFLALADEVEGALKAHATIQHPKYGEIYAYEVDGFSNHYLMDDANVPSLLAMAYLGDVALNDPIYQNTRRFVLSEDNPYFFRGTAGEGIGGPHVGYDMVWPMSIMMRVFTSTDDAEIKRCMQMLLSTDAGTGLMHESFHKDDASNYTRSWFAWQNTLFGELVLKLIDDGKLDLLNSL